MSNSIYYKNIELLKTHIHLKEEKLKEKFIDLYNDIIDRTSFLDNPTFSERKYCYINHISSQIRCEICGNPSIYRKCYGYLKCCSIKCRNIYEKTVAREKNFNTKLLKYNNGNYNGSEKVKITEEKRKEIGKKISETKKKFTSEKWIEIDKKIRLTKIKHFNNPTYNNPEKSSLTRYTNNKKYISKQPDTLYILSVKSLKIIKIGITSNLNKRIKDIKRESNIKDNIEISFSQKINKPWKIECILHKKYLTYNKPLMIGGGRTEWFDEIILKDVLKDIHILLSNINP